MYPVDRSDEEDRADPDDPQGIDLDDPQHCPCGRAIWTAPQAHVYQCPCGRLWLRPDCSEACETRWQLL